MWLKKTELHKNLRKIIKQILSSNAKNGYYPTIELEKKLRENPVADPFIAVLDGEIEPSLFSLDQGQDFNTWVEDVHTWLSDVQDPRNNPPPKDCILYIFWDRFSTDLADSLRAGRIVAAIPKEGYVLAFVGALQKCIVIHYRFFGFIPKLQPKVVIDKPQSVFDIWHTIESANQKSRNYLKNVLTSGHKLIYHRGILTHVDRRNEQKVFGPSIDTLVMAEELARSVYEPKEKVKRNDVVLEIGTGSGFLAASLVKNVSSIKKLICVDIESTAIACTQKNIEISSFAPGANKPDDSYIIGEFDSTRFNQKADLVVCNPPYIPKNLEKIKKVSTAPYLEAVGGLELIENVLMNLKEFLAEDGKLLLIVSHLSVKETEKLIEKYEYELQKPFGQSSYEVFFDVEAVLEDDEWIDFLIKRENKLIERSGKYFHRLHPLWVSFS